MPRTRLLLLALCTACASGDGASRRGLPTPPRPEPYAVRSAVAPGTLLNLAPVVVTGGGADSSEVLTALLREALIQTVRFDLVAPPFDGPQAVDNNSSSHTVHVNVDLNAGTATASLRRDSDPPLALAGTPFERAAPEAAIDTLGLRIRQSLGEEVLLTPVSCVLAHSHNPEVVIQGELGWERFLRGDVAGAQQAFERGRRRDGGSPVVLAGLVACASMAGKPAVAARIAQETLAYEHRLHPTATHRLTRALLLARATQSTFDASAQDRDLLQLAQVTARERPFDVEPQLSLGMAHNFLGQHAEAAEVLRALHKRLPTYSLVAYHLAYAELALGNAAASLAAIDSIGNRFHVQTTALPRALALYHSDRHDELDQHLRDLGQQPSVRQGPALHEVLRIRAAHAILRGDRDGAVNLLLEDLAWLRDHPSYLEDRAIDLAEAGEVLVRLGAHRNLSTALRGFDDLGNLPAQVTDALVFLGGMLECALTGERAMVAENSLAQRRGALEVWGNIVKAYGHHQRGELADEAAALARAAEFSQAPLIKAALAQTLRAMGQGAEADQLIDVLRREEFAIDLRAPDRHPLLNPAVALACLESN